METQKIVNLIFKKNLNLQNLQQENGTLLMTKIMDMIGRRNENDSTTKFEAKVIKPNLCYYSDAYILVTGDLKISDVPANTNVAFKNCAPSRCVTHKKDKHLKIAENLDIIMPMYNLIEYSDN